jgi:hypothetical protein
VSAEAAKRRALPPEVVDEVRRSVRGVLERAPAYAQATDDERRDLARGMVELGLVAAGLADEERQSAERLKKRRPMAAAQSAGDQLSMAATRAAAGTLTGLRDAIDFPNYSESAPRTTPTRSTTAKWRAGWWRSFRGSSSRKTAARCSRPPASI